MPKNVIMPALGVAQETGRLLKWLKAEGDQVRQSEMLLEIETDKATVELESPASGVLLNVTAHQGDEVPVGTVIAKIWGDGEMATGEPQSDHDLAPTVIATPRETTLASRATAAEASVPRPANLGTETKMGDPSESSLSRGRIPSSPKARRLAAERGVSLSSLSESAGGGPVVATSVWQADKSSDRTKSVVEVGRLWRIMADRTIEAWKSIPHFYLVREVDATNLTEWRDSLRGSVPPVTYTDLLVKKVAACLRSHPRLNSEWQNGTILQHSEINIGLAVAVDQGLVVPVIRESDKLAISEIAAQRKNLVDRAQTGKLGPDDLSAGTFTVSNLGMYGVDFFQAIVNPPQAAILAVGRIAPRVVPVDDQPAVRQMMTLSLSCDHRLVDGARAAQFLGELASSIERVSSSQQ